MTDPERWLHSGGAPPGMGEMLSAAQKAGPTAAQNAALAAKLGVVGSSAWLGPLLKSLMVGGVAIGVAWGVSRMDADQPANEHDASSSRKPDGELADGKIESEDRPSIADVPEASPTQADLEANSGAALGDSEGPLTQEGQTHPAQQRKKNAPTEVALIKAARTALESSPQQALALLTQHAALYPQGVLSEEREVLRIRALKNVGRLNEAATEEQKFRKEHPESVHHLP